MEFRRLEGLGKYFGLTYQCGATVSELTAMKTKQKHMTSTNLPGGTFKLADDLVLTRVGYGAMQLAGPHVFGPPADHDGASR